MTEEPYEPLEHCVEILKTVASDYRKALARIAELEAALKPFAEMADEYDAAFPRPLNICLAEYPEDYPLWCQARAALGEKE